MGQKWPNCDPPIRDFIIRSVELLKTEIGTNLRAIYLHGSLAMGSFYPPKSDVDLLVVIENPLDIATQKSLHQKCVVLSETRPMTGFLELSIVLADLAKAVKHPIAYELHYSEAFHEQIKNGTFDYSKAKGNDSDLAAHFSVARARGISLFGPAPDQLLGAVSWRDYMDAVMDDLRWILDDEHILESPFYSILNVCRVLQMLKEGEGTVSSKEEGALWALQHLPIALHPMISKALECYRSPQSVDTQNRRTGGWVWDKEALLAFRDYVRQAISWGP